MFKLRHLLAAAAFAASSILPIAQAAPIVILTLGQQATANTITGTVVDGRTTITATNIPVTITQINAGVVTPFSAFFSYNATSIADAGLFSAGPLGTVAAQLFNGNFRVTSGLGGTGTNILSATFTDNLVSGSIGGTGLTLFATDPPGTVNFTSDVIVTLLDPSTISIGLSAVTPVVSVVAGAGGGFTIAPFTASFANTNSATAPEPGTIALLGLAGLGLAFTRRRKGSSPQKSHGLETTFA